MTEPDAALDLSGVPCPLNAAKALLRLEEMGAGQVLVLILDGGEPVENVPPTLASEGHAELGRERQGDGRWRIWFRAA